MLRSASKHSAALSTSAPDVQPCFALVRASAGARKTVRKWLAILALALLLPVPAHGALPLIQRRRISGPRPAPPTRPQLPPPPLATIDNTLAVGGKDIKAREIDTRLSVDVKVNGRGPYHFIVDSGADTSAIGLGIAHDLSLPLGEPAILNGMTDRSIVDRVKVRQLTFGQSSVRNLVLPALREADLGADGLIGIDALTEQRLMMDFDKHLIKVEDGRTPLHVLPGDIVVTARRRRGQLILTEVRAGGIHLNAVIDTGSQITIGNLALRDRLLRMHRDKFWTIPVTGVTGVKANLQLAIVGELRLGTVTLRDVPMSFADVPPFTLFGLAHEPAMLVGTDVLETFRRVSLDFHARKVRFQLKTCKTEGIVISTSPTSVSSRLSGTGGEDVCGRF